MPGQDVRSVLLYLGSAHGPFDRIRTKEEDAPMGGASRILPMRFSLSFVRSRAGSCGLSF
jgi:hypothetical protein